PVCGHILKRRTTTRGGSVAGWSLNLAQEGGFRTRTGVPFSRLFPPSLVMECDRRLVSRLSITTPASANSFLSIAMVPDHHHRQQRHCRHQLLHHLNSKN